MFERIKIQEINDFFIDRDERKEKGVYFYRITYYDSSIREFIQRYYEETRLSGVVIEGGIANPDGKNLAYYEEIMGMDFQLSLGFLLTSLQRWLPRMNENQRSLVGAAMYDTLAQLQREGKNQGMLKNAYVKFMCWLYYKFERIINRLGEKKLPKILYEGKLSRYELLLFSILSKAGCDIVLLLREGEAAYQRVDGGLGCSDLLEVSGSAGSLKTGNFPPDFSIKELQKEAVLRQRRENLYGIRAKISNVTNTWIQEQTDRKITDIKNILIPVSGRGREENCFYNCFYQVNGVEDKLTYLQELYQLQMQVKSGGRPLLILEGNIPPPTMEEIQGIARANAGTVEEVLKTLSPNIRYTANVELQRHMLTVFLDLMLEMAGEPGMNSSRLMNRGVQLLCWLKRYQPLLFPNWKISDLGCMIYLGGCQNENEELFIRFMARLPVDVLLLIPQKSQKSQNFQKSQNPQNSQDFPDSLDWLAEDENLCRINFDQVMNVKKFPRESADLRLGTAAYHAEQELDSILYQDSGLYRDRQYSKSTVITLQTMYEEVGILWDQELKYRPNFSIVEDVVNIPVIFAKVSGVKEGVVSKYWSAIRSMVSEDTLVIRNGPYVLPETGDRVMPFARQWLKNGRLQREKIREYKDYPYGFLREELQDYLLDKLQLLLDQKCIRGTFENGTEYMIVSVVLTLNMDILRLAQRFDFTKKNPKLIYIHSTEKVISLEDSILAAYLHLLGFDVLFFVPTGYQTVERHFQGDLLEEHQAGEYLYDLRVPDFPGGAAKSRRGWLDKLFNR